MLFLLSLPAIANFTVVPMLGSDLAKWAWFGFGIVGLPIIFAGMVVFNPFPKTLGQALGHVLALPVVTGIWCRFYGGTLSEYFAVMLVLESLALLLSLCLMSFIPLKFYDPDNPKAKGIANYFIIILVHWCAAGFFIATLSVALWGWWAIDPFWRHPATLALLGVATIEYIVKNFRYQRTKQQTEIISIEPVLIGAPVPWLATLALVLWESGSLVNASLYPG